MKIAAYGTLRDNLHSAKYLTRKYGPDAITDLGTYRQDGHRLYAQWMTAMQIWCPFAVIDPEANMVVSLLEIANGPAAIDIDKGESWAYDKVRIGSPLTTDHVWMYQSRRHHPEADWIEVPDGDYAQWARNGFKL